MEKLKSSAKNNFQMYVKKETNQKHEKRNKHNLCNSSTKDQQIGLVSTRDGPGTDRSATGRASTQKPANRKGQHIGRASKQEGLAHKNQQTGRASKQEGPAHRKG